MSPLRFAFNYLQDPQWLFVATLAMYICHPVYDALCDLLGALVRLRHRRYVRRLNAVYEAHGVTYRHSSAPSHAGGGAR